MRRVTGLLALMAIMGILAGCYSTCQQPMPPPVAGYKGEG